jgi:hypothetical protein
MVLAPVTCPYCQSDQVIKGGQTETGKQRYRCQQTNCSHRSFVLEPAYNGRLPQNWLRVLCRNLLHWLLSVDWKQAGQNPPAGGRDAILHVRCPASG